ncbi:hypothetical protein RND81_11G023200 [Saponaria officinalis]|uniref:Retrovirus-related Pol polyprotein from transposon TNT 1-94-like beta-barrel domain-containing protein n=1 Tax=Saponaria officinalis TaxID=3572 RepID=A0AAW1HH69_SAPOF
MRRSLKSRRKFGFCDGSIAKPTGDFLLGQWEVVHCTVVQWIMNSIDPSLRDSVSDTEDAHLLWTELKDQYYVVDGAKIHALKTRLHECRQAKGMSVTTYYGNLKTLWDALAAIEPPLSCTSSGCTCGVTKAALTRQDSDRLHQFLMGLDKSLYGTIRNHQLSLDPLPTLNRVYHAVLQEERLLAGPAAVSDPLDVMANVVRGVPTPTSSAPPDWRALREAERQERLKLTCTHCSGSGHGVANCFIKTQIFPDWWGDRPRTLEELKSRPRKGGSRSQARANVLTVAPHASPSHDLDTGVSHHVTGDVRWLTESHNIPSCPISLPNGHTVAASVAGSVHINPSLILHNVLFVPSLTCNLLSMSQLVAATSSVLSFNNLSCHIQDCSLTKKIGIGELRDGLYYLRAEERAVVHRVSSDSSMETWHMRLGHLANKTIFVMFVIYPNNVDKVLA